MVEVSRGKCTTKVKHTYKFKITVPKAFGIIKRISGVRKDIKRIECFDISHFQGEATIASCVVYTDEGEDRKSHRRYNIKDIKAGDDYAAIHQVVSRRVSSGLEADNLPDVMIIDGSKGQIHQAEAVLENMEFKIKSNL